MTQVFVSYAHEDAKAAEQLRMWLADTIRHFGLTLWWDAAIQAGERWDPAIRQAIADSDIFFQLVSSAYLASSYITETEAPAIEQAERNRGALVLTIVLEKCSWKRRFGERQAIPADHRRDFRPVRDWRPQRDGWHAVTVQSEAAIEAWMRRPPVPRFIAAPGPTFGLTPDGFGLVDDPPATAERLDPQQVNLHRQAKRAADRLDSRIAGLQNTHPSVFGEYQDLKTFLGDAVAGTDVSGLWIARLGLEAMLARFSAPRAPGTMTEPIEPELLAGLDKVLGAIELYGLGFQEWRSLSARNRERAAEIADPVAEAVVTRAALDRLAGRDAPFAPSAHPVLTAASRPLPAADDPVAAANTPSREVVAASAGVGANALGALARSVVNAMISAGAVGSGIQFFSTMAGDPNLEWVRQAAIFLQAHCHPIADFAARHQDVRRLIGGAIDMLRNRVLPSARTEISEGIPDDDLEEFVDGDEFDYEAEAKKLILAGQAPPKAWIPYIRRLDFSDTFVTDVSPLSGLTALTSLDLTSTGVTDVSPLSGLTALTSLDLTSTGVTDVSPLSGPMALRSLDLTGTGVTDVSPLSGLRALTSLNLTRTGVTDVSPLSGLTALTLLDLTGTGVKDVSPLSGLTALTSLFLGSTSVTDVSPLSGVTALRSLDLSGTGLTDVSPLSGLKALHRLELIGTDVTDVSPLSGLTELAALVLDGTRVTDVSPLSGLAALEVLILSRTRVTDVFSLSGLTALKVLYLTGTGVTDVSPFSGLTALTSLDLFGTNVTDVSPLSGLAALELLDLAYTGVIDVSPLERLPLLARLRLSGLDLSRATTELPASVEELDLFDAKWPPDRPLPRVPWRIDPDGRVHGSMGRPPVWFRVWVDHKTEILKSRTEIRP